MISRFFFKEGDYVITVKHDGHEYLINHIKSANRQFSINDIPELSMIVINRENNPGYSFLNEEAILVTADGHEWRIRSSSQVTHSKNVKAIHLMFDLAERPFNQLLTGSYTAKDLLPLILNGTGFTLDIDPMDLEPIELEQWGHMSVWKALKAAIDAFGAECIVLPNRVIKVRKEMSVDKGQQIRYGYNLKNITKKTDSNSVVTHVIVNYGEGLAHSATFTSATANNYSRAVYGEIINDERITQIETAQKRAEEKFKDIEISYELNIVQTGESYELGEVVHTIYEPLDDLSITTRVIQTKEDWNGEEFVLTDVVVGNYVFQTADGILQGQINETNDKIDDSVKKMSLRFEETETLIENQYETITNEYTSAIDISARELTSEFDQKMTTTNAHIAAQYTQITEEYHSEMTQTAQQIRDEISASTTSINGEITTIKNDLVSVTQTTRSLQSTVSSHNTTLQGYGTRISSAEASITQQASEISQKVSQTDYNGNTIASLINQTAEDVTIDADKINLVGAVSVLSEISGDLGTVHAGNIFGANIDIEQDVKIGDNLYLGDQSKLEEKGIYFNEMARIIGGTGGYGAGLYISSENFELEGQRDIIFPTNAVNTGYVKSRGTGLDITVDSSNPKKLAVSQNGTYIGAILLA